MRFPLLKLSLLASSLCFAAIGHADTITVGTPGSNGNGDTIPNSVVYVINTSVAAGYTFSSINFTDYGASFASQYFTPELFTDVSTTPGVSTFTVAATGSELVIPANSGGTVENISNPFGSYVTTANTYFGFEELPDSNQSYPNDAVSFYQPEGPPTSGGTFLFNANDPYSASNTSLSEGTIDALNGRDYLITATASTASVTTSPTPEPSSLVLLGTGALALAGAGRQRFLKV
jgi:hypothetical protein